MTDREFRDTIKAGKICSQYLLFSDEGLLIDGAIKMLKDALMVDEAFDLEVFSISEVAFEDIVARFYVTPFSSNRRLLIIKNLEQLKKGELSTFAASMKKIQSANCLVMSYQMEKEHTRDGYSYDQLAKMFPNAEAVKFMPDEKLIHAWIAKKLKRDNITLSPSIISYLEDEFQNDITGLKNEFEKIENYLYEAKNLYRDSIQDLSRGLPDFNKYRLIDEFLTGKTEALTHFEELRPYLNSYPEIINALAWGVLCILRADKQVPKNQDALLSEFLNDITVIDRKVKLGSHFVHLALEVVLLKRASLFSKGVGHGREVA